MAENVYDNEWTSLPGNTILIASDLINGIILMINEICKKELSKENLYVKAKYFNWALVEDMSYNLISLMKNNTEEWYSQ